MGRRATGLILWGLAISALGIWHIVTWVQTADADKSLYKFAVGIFCLLVGILVVGLMAISNDKRKDN